MGTISSLNKCPKCGSENMTDDYNYKTQEFHSFCKDCGTSDSLVILRNNDRSPRLMYGKTESHYSNIWYVRRRSFAYIVLFMRIGKHQMIIPLKKRQYKQWLKRTNLENLVYLMTRRWNGKEHIDVLLKGEKESIPEDLLNIFNKHEEISN